MYGKYSMRDGVEWQIQHKAKLSVVHVFDTRSHLEYCIFCTSWVYSVLTDTLFCVRKISSSDSDGSECEAYKQIEAIVSESSLPHEYEMEYVTKYESALPNDKPAQCYI